MNAKLPKIAIVLSSAALLISLSQRISPPRWRADLGAKEPAQVVHEVLDVITSDASIQALQAHRVNNRDEILRTIEVAETSESGNYGIIFFRYSIGSDIFRQAYWITKINNKWYWMPNLEYAYSKPKDGEWFANMKRKKAKWESESAKSMFD
jgi:hypothetical protein